MTATLVVPQADRFAEALLPQVMGPRLATITAAARGVGPGWDVGRRPPRCHVLDAKYEPGVRAIILYELAGHLLRGDLLEPGDADGWNDAPVIDPGVAVSAFPHDPEMPSLSRVMDARQLGPALAGAVDGSWSRLDSTLAARCRISLLRYRPGKRATSLVTHGMASPLVVKAYHNTIKAAAVVDEEPRLQALTNRHGLLAFAPVVAFVPDLAVVVQQPVKGTPLDALLGGPLAGQQEAQQALRKAARSLAELHDGRLITTRARPVERELVRFSERASRIATMDPAVGAAAGRLADRLMAVHSELPAARLGTVHGDCKPSQFLIGSDRVFLLDLDHCGIGDQAGDVGTFLATLCQREIRHALAGRSHLPARAADARAEVFIQEYRRSCAADRHIARIHWQTAVALERKALRAFARAPRSPMSGALIREAEGCLDNLMETL